jgi:hypothetical protein
MNLTQLERIKTELKHERYGWNKIEKEQFAINYRFEGLAKKHIDLRIAWMGFMCESGIFEGGYLQIGWDTKIDLRITRNYRGSCANRPFFFLYPNRSGTENRESTPTGGSGGLGRRRSGRREAWSRLGTDRGDQGELDGGLTSGGGRRERLDFTVNAAAASWSGGGSVCRRRCRARHGWRRRARARAGTGGGALGLDLLFMGARAQAAASPGGGAMRVRMGPTRACGGRADWVRPLARPNLVG